MDQGNDDKVTQLAIKCDALCNIYAMHVQQNTPTHVVTVGTCLKSATQMPHKSCNWCFLPPSQSLFHGPFPGPADTAKICKLPPSWDGVPMEMHLKRNRWN